MSSSTHVACLYLAPWALTLVAREHPGLPVAVLSETQRRVVAVNEEAHQAGVEPGMRESAALSRCPDLHAEVVSGPSVNAAWNELLETLYARFSDRVEGCEAGVAYLRLTLPAARELAAALHARVGLADSKEVALLAALRAKEGEVKAVPDLREGGQGEKLFLQLTPRRDLWALGVSAEQMEHLRFLGVTGLADLWKWSAAQREAFLGVDAARKMGRFLKGERSKQVQRYVPGQVIEGRLVVDAPLTEPAPLEAALRHLLPPLWTALRGRTAAYLTVQAQTPLGQLTVTRHLKWPLDGESLIRLACLSLLDSDALPLGIDALTVQLSGLQQPSRMVGLWAGLADLEVTQRVLDRYPDALVKVHWLDPFAYAADAQYEWVDWLTGAVKPTALTPKRPTLSPAQKRQRAVERTLAFFEGARP